MRIHKIELDFSPYQPVKMPNGAAPLSVQEDGPNKIGFFFIGPDTLLGEYVTDFGVFVIATGVTIPDDVVLFPRRHPLVDKVTQPNARYVGTVSHHHVILGNPRPQLAES